MPDEAGRVVTHVLVAEPRTLPPAAMPAGVRLAPAPADVADFLHDESKLAAPATPSLAIPESVEALREVLRWHAAEGHRVCVSGTRSGLAGGAVPDPGVHVVSLTKLRGVLAVDDRADPPTATVLAGTWLSELTSFLAAHHPGLVFLPDPTETSASIGGMVATNASGARSYRFGATREWVIAIVVELPSGRTLRLRRGEHRARGGELHLHDGDEVRALDIPAIPKPATKNSVGYAFTPGGDALDLFVGAEGTLGAMSEVTVRLARIDEQRLGFLQCFAAAEQAFTFVDALRAERAMATTAIEFLDARSHTLARESGRPEVERVLAAAPAGSCSVFVEVGYGDDDALALAVERLERLAAGAGGDPAAAIAGIEERDLRDIRTFRHAVPERINAIIAERRRALPALHKIATDMAVPDAELRWVHALYQDTLERAGLDFASFGHVGNNHFHVNILPRDEAELSRGKALYADFARHVVARGGCVAAEHGIGRLKKGFLAVQYPPAVLDTMRAVKRWADPAWRFNPGVLLDP